MHILAVDDDPAVLKVVTATLRRNGYSVAQASSGEEALKVCETIGNKLRLVLTDITMPGMSGLELADQVARIMPRPVPVILMSGFSQPTVQVDHKHRYRFIAKPFQPRNLLDAISEALNAADPS